MKFKILTFIFLSHIAIASFAQSDSTLSFIFSDTASHYIFQVCDTTYKNYKIKITIIDTTNIITIRNLQTKQAQTYKIDGFKEAAPELITDSTIILCQSGGTGVNTAYVIFLNKHKMLWFNNLASINPHKPLALIFEFGQPNWHIINYFTQDTLSSFKLSANIYRFLWKNDTIIAIDYNNKHYYFPFKIQARSKNN